MGPQYRATYRRIAPHRMHTLRMACRTEPDRCYPPSWYRLLCTVLLRGAYKKSELDHHSRLSSPKLSDMPLTDHMTHLEALHWSSRLWCRTRRASQVSYRTHNQCRSDSSHPVTVWPDPWTRTSLTSCKLHRSPRALSLSRRIQLHSVSVKCAGCSRTEFQSPEKTGQASW